MALTGFTGLLPSFTGFMEFFSVDYRVLLGFTWVVLGLVGFSCILTWCYWFLPGFIRFYGFSVGSSGFYLVLLGFTVFFPFLKWTRYPNKKEQKKNSLNTIFF